MAKEKKKPVMNKSANDRTLYDELRIQERIDHMNKLCQKIAGMNGYEMFATEIKSQYDFKENEISKEELAEILENENKKLIVGKSSWENLRQGTFPHKKETRDYYAEKLGMDFYDFMIYVNNGEEDEYPCDPTYPTEYLKEHIVDNEQVFYYYPEKVCEFLGITEDEWQKALNNENKICFAFADYLEKYFDLFPGVLTKRVDPTLADICEHTHYFSEPPMIREEMEKAEFRKWKKVQESIEELGSCIVIHRMKERPYIIRDLRLCGEIIRSIPQKLLKEGIEQDHLNNDWSTIYVWDEVEYPPHKRSVKFKKVYREDGSYYYEEDGVKYCEEPVMENNTVNEK